ncbi:glycosyltransferase [Clostridium sp.]|uniref:glycosyltransferase family 2 protein n=1 Tax=Clostridium sp. TaxID=1506 RepID=UPI00262DF7E8|nr:glycosyltransferase [Clostridium sp.]
MVSLIIPVFNVEEYLEECLESIIAQSFSDYEVILVDDGSTDKSRSIINDYEKRFNNIKILYQKNKGVSEARNLALKHASGEYVLYVDSDDFLKSNMLELMVNKAKKTKTDIVICNYTLYYGVNSSNNKEFSYNIVESKMYYPIEAVDMMLNFKLQGQLWNKLFKRSLLIENNFEFEPGRYIQDIFPVFKVINKSGKIAFIDEALYYYRQRETSTIHKRNIKLVEDYYHAMYSIIQYIIENKIKVNATSFKVFKASVLSYFIYHYTNANAENSYKDFKISKYISLDIKIRDFIFLKNLNKREKLRLLLWKLKVFNLIKKIRIKILLIIN